MTDTDPSSSPLPTLPSGPTGADVLENDKIATKLFSYLSQRDLLTLSLTNKNLHRKTRTYTRDNLNSEAKTSRIFMSCQSLRSLDTCLGQMQIIPFNGIKIHVNYCDCHPRGTPGNKNVEEEFPNIFTRLTLKSFVVHYAAKKDSLCWLAVELTVKLLEKIALNLVNLDIVIDGDSKEQESEMLRLIHGSNVYRNVKTLSLQVSLPYGEDEAVVPILRACPNLTEVRFKHDYLIPLEFRHLQKQMVFHFRKWWDFSEFKRFSQDKISLDVLTTSGLLLEEAIFKPGHNELILENLMQVSRDSMKKFIFYGQEFPKFSSFDIPPMPQLQQIVIVYSLNDPWFLKDLGHLCSMLPNLKQVAMIHHPCPGTHADFQAIDETKVNLSAEVLSLQNFDLNTNVLMKSLAKIFPNLEELQLNGCDSSTLNGIFHWPQLECLVLTGKNMQWTDNFDHVMLGVQRDELDEFVMGNIDVTSRPSIISLQCLRRLYVCGGCAGLTADGQEGFLSSWVMSVVMSLMPNLVLRLIGGQSKGFKLEHLEPFDNLAENLWCPPFPLTVGPPVRFGAGKITVVVN